MSSDAFRRLALLAASSAYAFGLVLIAVFLHPGWALVVFGCGGIVAVGMTIEERARPSGNLETEPAEPEGASRADLNRLHERAERGE